MTLGDRISARAEAQGISQSELARRVGVGSTTINGLVKGNARWSPYLPKIARALDTSIEFLVGEIDDPRRDGTLPTPEPTVQHIMMPCALPAERVLTAMFRGFLASMPDLRGDELAHELAKLLPIGLQQQRGPLRFEASEQNGVSDDELGDPRRDSPERQRASRT